MKITNIKQIAFIVVMGLFLSACNSKSSNNPVAVLKVPQCGTADDLGKAIAKDVTGKTIKKVDDGAKVRIWHSPDSTKLACMISGEAIIVDTN